MPREIVEKVVSFQFRELDRMMASEPTRSVEISNFGVFRVTSVRLGRMLKKLYKKKDLYEKLILETNMSDARKATFTHMVRELQGSIDALNRKQMRIDFKGIMEGVKNSIFVKEQVELVAKERSEICKGCSKNSDHQKKYGGYKSFRPDLHCTVCGCDIHLKTRSMSSSCPLGKWVAQVTEEQEDELKKKIDGTPETQ